MAIATTTPWDIEAAIVPLIESMTPTALEGRDEYKWFHVQEGNPESLEARTFKVYHSIAEEDPDGIHGGDGIGYKFEFRVRTSYYGLDETLAKKIVWQDGKDLWLLIHPRPDGGVGSVPGLLACTEPLTTEIFDEGEGYLVVDFILKLRFKAADS